MGIKETADKIYNSLMMAAFSSLILGMLLFGWGVWDWGLMLMVLGGLILWMHSFDPKKQKDSYESGYWQRRGQISAEEDRGFYNNPGYIGVPRRRW